MVLALLMLAASPEWREDIDFMVSRLSAKGMTIDLARGPSSRGQKDFEKLYPAATYGPAIARLKETLPEITDAEVVLEIMRLHASAKVAHNTVGIPGTMGFQNRLPVSFAWYADGLVVRSAAAAYREIIGKHVVKIGSMTPAQLLAGVTPYIAQENDVWVKDRSVRLMVLEPVLKKLGLIEAAGSVTITVEGGREASVRFSAKEEAQEHYRKVLQVPATVYASGPNRYYWHRYLPESRTMYIRYDVCAKDPKLSMRDFTRQVEGELDSRGAERIVLDLRFNGGGDSRVINPLKDAVSKKNLVVLIGPGTFSSAILNAIELKQRGAILVGEATGGKPSGYGEIKEILLPNSKLKVRFTSKRFSAPRELEADSLTPDIEAPMAFRDILQGIDAGLNAAIAAKKP
jgi:hypothetical protein